MKTKLLSLLLISGASFAQAPIDYYLGYGTYAIVTSETAIDQSAVGGNQLWDFTNLTEIGNTTIEVIAPSEEDLVTYPNTTEVTVTNDDEGAGVGYVYTSTVDGTVSVMGAITTGRNVNFNTGNVTIGTFPLVYGDTYNDDNVSGTYDIDGYEGTFTGTSTTSVDAYGTLTANIGTLESGNVTRLKTVLSITLNYNGLPEVGTAVQTVYSYYKDFNDEDLTAAKGPVFRTTSTTTVVPFLSLDQTDISMEAYTDVFLLSTPSNPVAARIQLSPNPVQNVLSIQSGDQLVRSLTISDLNGRTIKSFSSPGSSLNLNDLSNGMYFAQITTDQGVSTQKIIKK